MFGLRKTLSSLFTRHRVDEAWFDHLEELLIKADVGVATSTFLITSLRKSAKEHAITNSEDLKADLVSELSHHLSDLEPPENPLNPSAIHAKPEVWLIVGVNGAGKTTSIGKLCHHFQAHTGQNGIAQVLAFRNAIGLHGLIVTKLDGTAKGGVICALRNELEKTPKNQGPKTYVYALGKGEQLGDLELFSAQAYAKELVE
ncbi:MAG: hypothetical protein EBW34_02460 [Burkholderiaceae bacterium]|nr:hypothetical protein [Burkholderiaceae bacterium]